MTHPHHPLYGQRVQLIRIRRGPDPDLIIRMPDGYHGAIAASLTDYAGVSPADGGPRELPLLSIEGLWQIAILYPSLRAVKVQVKVESMGRLPPTLLSPLGMKALDL